MDSRGLSWRRGAAVVGGTALAAAFLRRRAGADPAERRALVQKRISKLIYGWASRAGADPGMAFLNYGYAPLDGGGAEHGTDPDPDRFGKALYARVAEAVPLEGRDVLEVGCGRGGGAAYVVDRFRPRSMVGLDLARSAIERGRREHARTGLELVEGDAEALPFADGSFDAVLNVESAHWYPHVETFLTEAFRVLRPGGHLLLADLRHAELPADAGDQLMPRTDMRRFAAQLEASPFELVEREDITANVRRALELDSARRRAMIERGFARPLRKQALAFSGVVGTPLYEGLASGELTYQRFVLRKAA
jgi:ubiquinone/menaquinone biosynthesis C-methylase UbiE